MTTHSKTDTADSVPTVATTLAPPTVAVKLPPADANIPAPPQGFVPTHGTDYRGLLPKKTELAVLPAAVAELRDFADFALTFGKTIPSQATVLRVLDSAEQWSSMRAKASEWDLYCRTQEGLAWKDARTLIAMMRQTFDMAAAVDATVASEHPSVMRLLTANTTIAKRAALTRKARRQRAEEERQKAAAAPAPQNFSSP